MSRDFETWNNAPADSGRDGTPKNDARSVTRMPVDAYARFIEAERIRARRRRERLDAVIVVAIAILVVAVLVYVAFIPSGP